VKSNLRFFIAFGTRPEAIKLAPLIVKLTKKLGRENIFVCNTGQHRDLVREILFDFNLNEDCDLNLMLPNQTPTKFLSSAILAIENQLTVFKPSLVIVQGDTMSGLAAAFAAKYNRIPVAHVEAGLRTHDWMNPFPEEINRQIIARLTDIHFAATKSAMENLISEGISDVKIHVTGNTAIDALFEMSLRIGDVSVSQILSEVRMLNFAEHHKTFAIAPSTQIVLVTLHRRESFGEDIREAMRAIKSLAELFPEFIYLFPAHPNPNVRTAIQEIFGDSGLSSSNLVLCEPLNYRMLVAVLKHCALVITDSGGIQEEAPALGVPVVVARHSTERTESIDLKLAFLVGPNFEKILEMSSLILNDSALREELRNNRISPFGDGNASRRITENLTSELH